MKNIVVVILLLTFGNSINILAQVDTSWVRRLNGPMNSSDAGKMIKIDSDGYIYVGANISITPGFTDASVIKYNSNGDTLWVKYFNNPFDNGSSLNDMQIDNNGNVIVTGQCGGSNLDDFFTIKFDPDGNTIWSERYDNGEIDIANSLFLDDAGNVFVTGTSWKVYQSYNFLTIKYSSGGDTIWSCIWKGPENAADIAEDLSLDSFGNVVVAGTCDWYWGSVDYVIIKLNTAGDTAWVRNYDSPEHAHDNLKALVIDNQDNIYVTGDIYKPGGNHDIVTVKYNVYGDTLWTRKYNGSSNGDDFVHTMEIDSAGNIYLAGSSFVSGTGIDCLTMKYSSSGELLWFKTYAEYSNYSDGANSMTLDNFGNIYTTGSAGTSSSNIAYLTLKYDNDGNEKWATTYDGPLYNGYDVASSICVDNSGYVYITGSSAGVSSNSDVATIKYAQTPNDVNENSNEIPAIFNLSQNYPNPFNPSTKISWQSPVGSWQTLKVIDVLGNEIATLVDEYKSAGSYEVEFNSHFGEDRNLSSGVYFYQLKVGSETSSGRDFIQIKKMILLK
jgi:uncharacterized delta-60 repeat protein